ncbi:MAG: endolytic transglycosylase MltG [Campylobacterota bacterium]|nr:endolytic transglycosylase MltG [Campylobacterota bacterium]
MLNIPKGSTNFIITYLDKKNYDLNYIDKLTVKMLGYPQSGWIDLKSTKMTKIEFLYKLTTSKAALKKVTLIPGETYYFFLQEVANKLDISTTKLFESYSKFGYKIDGNIIADTYYLPLGMDENQLIQHLFNQTNIKYEKFSKKIFGVYDKKNWFRYIIIASIIQKEAASKNEMPKISSVIYNRLKKNMKLQMDGTLNYGKYSHQRITPKFIKEDKSDYNTYKIKGLPSNPVCAVEFEAIKAAIFPSSTDYLYFMKSADGKYHDFSNSYKKHRRNISKIKKLNKIKKQKINKKNKKVSTKKTSKNDNKLKNLWK